MSYQAQSAAAPEDPDLPFRTLRLALDAACAAAAPVDMAELTLLHARRLARQQVESVLDALASPGLPPEVALGRAWGLADALEAQARVYALLVIAWKLKSLGRLDETRATVARLDDQPLPDAGDYRYLTELLLAWLEPEIDVTRWAPVLLPRDGDLRRLASRMRKAGSFDSATRIALREQNSEERVGSLCDTAEAMHEAGRDCTAVIAAAQAEAERSDYARARSLRNVAKTLARTGRTEQARAFLPAIDDDYYLLDARLVIARTSAEAGQFDDALSVARAVDDAAERAEILAEIGAARSKAGGDSGAIFSEALAVADLAEDDDEDADSSPRGVALKAVAACQARAGRFEEAEATASRIVPQSDRRSALRKICEAKVDHGLLADALLMAGKFEQADARADLLLKIAEAQFDAGLDCTSTLAEAAAAVAEPQGEKLYLWRYLGLTQAKCGHDSSAAFSAALVRAQNLDDREDREFELGATARALAETGLFEQASSAASAIENELRRAPVVAHIALHQARAGAESGAAFAQALALGAKSKSAFERSWTRKEIAAKQLEAGQLREALATVLQLEAANARDAGLCDVIEAYATAGEGCTTLFAMALPAADPGEELALRTTALSAIARVQCESGQNCTAALSCALKLAAAISEPVRRARAYCSIASAEANAGLASQPAFASARKAAAQINDLSESEEVYLELARAQNEAGDFGGAISTAGKIRFASDRSEILLEIGSAQTRAGLSAAATLSKAASTAQRIDTIGSRAAALTEIAVAQVKAGLPADALSTVKRIRDAGEYVSALARLVPELAAAEKEWSPLLAESAARAPRIRSANKRVDPLLLVAKTHAGMGLDSSPYFAQALQAADTIRNKSERSFAIRRIAGALAEAGRFADALSAVTLIRDERQASYALAEISNRQADAGLFEEALFSARKSAALGGNLSSTLAHIAVAVAKADRDSSELFAEAVSAAEKTDLRLIASAKAEAGLDSRAEFSRAVAAAAGMDDRKQRSWELRDIALECVRAGLLSEALTAADAIETAQERKEALHEIALAQAEAGELEHALATVDMIPLEQADALEEVGSIIAKMADGERVKSALAAYLLRAARDPRTAWQGCAILARLFPASSADLVRLICAS